MTIEDSPHAPPDLPTNPPTCLSPHPSHQEAVALTYGAGDAAPRVVAKGRGLIAREIIERAREAGVIVHESPELVGLLMQVDLDARIPPELYVAIAELLAWLYGIEQRATISAYPGEAARPPAVL
ncbi:EscU/YscU/HrcU family type III secretion system export apparatus switch protein [Azoarcus sp. PA01]|nr:EscU/YscU/HrcU family type III secretion system export apparatus switch protein [Azoarcus sp. PA01]